MPIICLRTEIKAKRTLVFDLSRSIDLHLLSTLHTNEIAIAGKTSGLIALNEWVTWRAKHFGIYQQLTSKVTAYDRPNSFTDEMVSGAFKSFRHDHHFEDTEAGTLMMDTFAYRSPLGLLGRSADVLFLNRYMTRLLTERNAVIKEYAETGKWKAVLDSDAMTDPGKTCLTA